MGPPGGPLPASQSQQSQLGAQPPMAAVAACGAEQCTHVGTQTQCVTIQLRTVQATLCLPSRSEQLARRFACDAGSDRTAGGASDARDPTR